MKKILFIMDPLEKLNYKKDTSIQLIRGAFAKNYDVYFCEMKDLDLIQFQCHAFSARLHFNSTEILEKSEEKLRSLSDFSYVFLRSDPPFDRNYFYASLFLDYVSPSTKVINKPQSLRNNNEKLASLFYPEYTVDTLVSSNKERILQFIDSQERCTLKPIDGFAGRGILFSSKEDPDKIKKIEEITHMYSHKIVVQSYIPEAKFGDKRVLLWNGKVLGAILRLHPEGKEINNLDAGGSAHKSELSARQKEISEHIALDLKKQSVYFAGIDFLGDHLIEINNTSPTGLVQLCEFENRDFHIEIMEDLENI